MQDLSYVSWLANKVGDYATASDAAGLRKFVQQHAWSVNFMLMLYIRFSVLEYDRVAGNNIGQKAAQAKICQIKAISGGAQEPHTQ